MEFRIRNLPDKTHRQLSIIAATKGKSINDTILEALEVFCQKSEKTVKESVHILYQSDNSEKEKK